MCYNDIFCLGICPCFQMCVYHRFRFVFAQGTTVSSLRSAINSSLPFVKHTGTTFSFPPDHQFRTWMYILRIIPCVIVLFR